MVLVLLVVAVIVVLLVNKQMEDWRVGGLDREEGCWGTRNGKRVISAGRTGGCRCDSSNGDSQMERWMEGRWPSRVIVLGVDLRGWLNREGKKC